MMKTVGIYHDKDLDGLMCAAIMKKHFQEECRNLELIGWDYSYDHPKLIKRLTEIKPDRVIIADLSLPPEMMYYLKDMTDLHWIDHHKTAIQQINPENFAGHHLNVSFAACELLWEYLFTGKEMPELVRVLGAYDTWRKDEDWESHILPVQMYYNQLFSIDELLNDLSDPSISKQLVTGRAYLEHEQSQFAHAFRLSWIHPIHGREVRLFNGLINPGRFRDYCQHQDPETDIVCTYYQTGANQWKYSLRSRWADVSKIAQRYGGGGHKHAAGFTHTTNLFAE